MEKHPALVDWQTSSGLPKAILRFKHYHYQNQHGFFFFFFAKPKIPLLKFISRDAKSPNNPGKEHSWGTHTSLFENLLQAVIIMVL